MKHGLARMHAHTHFFFISKGLAGSLPGLQQSLTEETEDFLSWATFYQLYQITMQTQLSALDIVSIFKMHLTPFFRSVKFFPLFPASLFNSPPPPEHCHYHPLLSLGDGGSAGNGSDSGWWGPILRECVDRLLWLFTCCKVEDTWLIWIRQWQFKLIGSPSVHCLCAFTVRQVMGDGSHVGCVSN